MANYIRARGKGATYFFTVAIADRRTRLLTDHIDLLRRAYVSMNADRAIICQAMVVLPDHLHAVWTLPDGDGDFSTRWAVLKSQFTRLLKKEVGYKPTLRSLSKINKADAGVWQRRFWEHQIRDRQDLRLHIDYCWKNPVKHGLCERAADWPYSSVHRDFKAGVIGA